MTHMREHWEGVSLPGNYRLEKWLNGDDAGEYFETAELADGRRAVVKLVPESAAGSAGRLALWERARSLRHPNLLEVLDCGRAERAGEAVVFGVFEAADDTLAAAIGRSPLSEEEAGEVLTAVVGGLTCLQGQGLAHSALDADHVLGVGEQIKLSTDALREAPVGAPYSRELRALWSRISPFAPARSEELLAQALGGEPDAAASVKPATVPVAAPAPATVPAKVPPTAQATRPAAPTPPRPAASAPAQSKPAGRARFSGWVFGGAAAIVLVVLGLNLRRTPEEPARPAPAPVTAGKAAPGGASATAPSTPEVVAPKASPFAEKGAKPATVPKTAPATQTTPTATAPPADTTAPASATGVAPKVMWRVIAFTYLSHDAAAKKVDQLKQTHAGLEPSVFEPHHRKGFFLVALGGFMTRTDALRLQAKAREQGLPRDVYIHNFVE